MEDWSIYKPEKFTYRGSYIKNWFSNMDTHPFELDGSTWPSVEVYYQSHISTDPIIQNKIKAMSSWEAKKFARTFNKREDWNDVKETIMYNALYAKFTQNPQMQTMLLSTNDDPIIEWNNWEDVYWGVNLQGKGKNRLGVLLMQVRENIK